MAAIIEITDKDLLRGTVVDPAWYRVKILSVGEEPAKAQEGKAPSTNFPVEAEILFEGDTGNTKFKGVPVTWVFNSKAVSFAVGFLKALGVEVTPGRFNLESAVGQEMDIYIENDTYNNRLKNSVNHKYRPIRPDVKAV